MAITAFRAPAEAHDLTLDRRRLFDPQARVLQHGAQETIIEAFGEIHEALQEPQRSRQVTVEVSLPIPLAVLLGHELRWTTQVKVTIITVNPSGDPLVVEPAAPVMRSWPDWRVEDLPGAGPAVSVGAELGAAADRWAAEHDARSIEGVHIDRDPATDPLDGNDVRSLAAHSAKRLNKLHGDGAPKHLLLRGPAVLDAAVGLAATASGPPTCPSTRLTTTTPAASGLANARLLLVLLLFDRGEPVSQVPQLNHRLGRKEPQRLSVQVPERTKCLVDASVVEFGEALQPISEVGVGLSPVFFAQRESGANLGRP